MCKQSGCSELLSSPGYCDKHQKGSDKFKKQNDAKTEETKSFYSSSKWTMTSRNHREKKPLCEECKKKGIRQKADLVHHVPELTELLKQNKNPYDEQYLFSLCFSCHQKELNKKKDVPRRTIY